MKNPLKYIVGNVFTGIFGGLVFLLFFFVLKVNPLVSAMIAIAAFAGVALLMPSGKDQKFSGGIQELMNSTIENGKLRIAEMRAYAPKVKKPQVRSDIEILCLNFENIIKEYKKNPDNFKIVLGYYLDSICNIVKKYSELAEADTKSPEMIEAAGKCENIIRTANEVLTKQLQDTFKEDMIDLNAEIAVLEKTLKTEGFN